MPIMFETTSAAAGQVETACLTGVVFTLKRRRKMPSHLTRININRAKVPLYDNLGCAFLFFLDDPSGGPVRSNLLTVS